MTLDCTTASATDPRIRAAAEAVAARDRARLHFLNLNTASRSRASWLAGESIGNSDVLLSIKVFLFLHVAVVLGLNHPTAEVHPPTILIKAAASPANDFAYNPYAGPVLNSGFVATLDSNRSRALDFNPGPTFEFELGRILSCGFRTDSRFCSKTGQIVVSKCLYK
ncbi:hypothetical protein EVAR_35405_1 [Eumeta japonica]|uniref:Uncharacterized protein n=1 Tax=Eumeta variegata TaxID=151549 RepID=A0A4C1XF30_EUMVA|nr:hypothetical protein EVAR_35405_1 [Eumeta japonica]